MAVKTEGARAESCVLSEANGTRSRDVVTILADSGVITPGTVLGKITASGKYKPATATGSDGAQTAAAVALTGVDSTGADGTVVALVRDAEVIKPELSYHSSVDDQAKKDAKNVQLAGVGILAR